MVNISSGVRSEFTEPLRIKSMYFGTHELEALVRQGEQIDKVYKVLNGVPADAKLIMVIPASSHLGNRGDGVYAVTAWNIHLIYEHPDWDEIAPNAYIPEIICTLCTNPEEIYSAEQLEWLREFYGTHYLGRPVLTES